jgi:hypothetical protein
VSNEAKGRPLSVKEVAERLRCSEGWVRRKYLSSVDGKPPILDSYQVPPKGEILIYEADFNKFLEQNKRQ